MQEHHAIADDQSHYEISLTAGQAFLAFVLLLLSLAASFAFGLMIGKGQADERLVVQKATPVVTEAALTPKRAEGRIVELGVENEDFQETATTSEAAPEDASVAAVETPAPTLIEEAAAERAQPAADPAPASAAAAPARVEVPSAAPAKAAAPPAVITYAQLLSTENQKTAESLAARLIDRGFTAAYVERGSTDKGPIYRVRVKFASELEARAAESKLREFSKDVWITTR